MLKRFMFCLGLTGVLFSSSVSFAQESKYVDLITKLNEKAREFKDFLGSNPFEINTFDKWYKEFKPTGEEFVKQFFKSDVSKQSYKLTREGVDNMALIWSALTRVKDNDELYISAISSGDGADAHKWKVKATDGRKKAQELLDASVSCFDKAKDLAENGE